MKTVEITYFGHSCFKIRTKTGVIVTDPFDPTMVGLKYPKVKANIVTISHFHPDHNFLGRITGEPFVIEGPGEYEVGGVSILGIESDHDDQRGKERGLNTVYLIEAEGLRIGHLGDLGHRLEEAQLEALNELEILMIPVGGVYTIGPKEAVEVVGQIEPKVVVPMHYRMAGMAEDFTRLAPVDDFLKEMGVEVEPFPKYSISKDRLPEEREVVVLGRRS